MIFQNKRRGERRAASDGNSGSSGRDGAPSSSATSSHRKPIAMRLRRSRHQTSSQPQQHSSQSQSRQTAEQPQSSTQTPNRKQKHKQKNGGSNIAVNTSTTTTATTSPKSPLSSMMRRQGRKQAQRSGRRRDDSGVRIEEMNVNETNSGYEVSLDPFNGEESREPQTRKKTGAPAYGGRSRNRYLPHNRNFGRNAGRSQKQSHGHSSGSSSSNSSSRSRRRDEFKSPLLATIQEQLRHRQRLHRSQFSLDFPALSMKTRSALASIPSPANVDWRPKKHRIPLLGFSIPESPYDDVLQLLRSAPFSDESKAVDHELDEIDRELAALEADRGWIETNWGALVQSTSRSIETSVLPTSKSCTRPRKHLSSLDWDANRLLDCPHSLANGEQIELQHNRGMCLSVRIQNFKTRENFLAKCGHRHKQPYAKHGGSTFPYSADIVTISPKSCRMGGAGATVQQVAVLGGSSSNTSSSAFFMSRDNQKSTTWGHLPPKLFRRMKQGAGHDVADLEYLSTGPRGCYYAQFRSGECWWGSAVDDSDFHNILTRWDVYRVVFGPIVVMEDEYGQQRMTSSWIVLGCDGRAAWKNLPSRLHHRLETRLADRSAPAEVTLGPGDSYYVKFLDGTVDYCLPAMIARVCEHIELNGGVITNLAMHPENSHDFVIRHTEMQ